MFREHGSTGNLQSLLAQMVTAVLKHHLVAFHMIYSGISQTIQQEVRYKILQAHNQVEVPLLDSGAHQHDVAGCLSHKKCHSALFEEDNPLQMHTSSSK